MARAREAAVAHQGHRESERDPATAALAGQAAWLPRGSLDNNHLPERVRHLVTAVLRMAVGKVRTHCNFLFLILESFLWDPKPYMLRVI